LLSSRAIPNKLSTTCLTLGILGWGVYLLQWCFDLTLGLLLAAVTAGTSAVCATVLDFLPFVLWISGILAGHVALGQIKQTKAPGRRRAIWGLLLGYSGMVFTILFIALIVVLVAGGVGVGILDKIQPAIPWK
jgi:hypothetical protein